MKKKFDCVKMKHDIQEKLHKEMEDLSLRKKMEYLGNKKITDSILQKFIPENSNYEKFNHPLPSPLKKALNIMPKESF